MRELYTCGAGMNRPFRQGRARLSNQLGFQHCCLRNSISNVFQYEHPIGYLKWRACSLPPSRPSSRNTVFSNFGNMFGFRIEGHNGSWERRVLSASALQRRRAELMCANIRMVLFCLSSCLPCLQGKSDEARPLFERALAIRREKLGDGHKHTIITSDALKDMNES